jgi:Protein of unknown function (DUF3142)
MAKSWWQWLRLSRRWAVLLLIFAIAAVLAMAWTFHRPRKWAPKEVPVAFWAWRGQSANQEDIDGATQQLGTRVLFLRAGQIDYSNKGELARIRTVRGTMPRAVDLHLVYNGTRTLLGQLESIDEASLAAVISSSYLQDRERATKDQAAVAGIQLDIDVPTRLLKRYAKLLHSLRSSLPAGTTISITGLPTWMNSEDLPEVLKETDFWIPQCYGAEIPQRLSDVTPIASPREVTAAVSRARRLGKPFYAGLAAYSYVLLYGRDERLVFVRGDMDPALIANDSNLEFVQRNPFDTPADKVASEWRYIYRVKKDCVIDDLVLLGGELLVVDVPTTESLRASARAVREAAGDQLLGICIFRLPSGDDLAALPLARVAAAVKDFALSTEPKLEAKVTDAKDGQSVVSITLADSSIAGALLNDSIKVDVSVESGAARVVNADGYKSVESLCSSISAAPQPCSERLANTFRLRAHALPAGRALEAGLLFRENPPTELNVNVEMLLDDGRTLSRQQVVHVEREEEHVTKERR